MQVAAPPQPRDETHCRGEIGSNNSRKARPRLIFTFHAAASHWSRESRGADTFQQVWTWAKLELDGISHEDVWKFWLRCSISSPKPQGWLQGSWGRVPLSHLSKALKWSSCHSLAQIFTQRETVSTSGLCHCLTKSKAVFILTWGLI